MPGSDSSFEERFRAHLERSLRVTEINLGRADITKAGRENLEKKRQEYKELLAGTRKAPSPSMTKFMKCDKCGKSKPTVGPRLWPNMARLLCDECFQKMGGRLSKKKPVEIKL